MLPNPFSEFIELLEKHGVEYLVVGGFAVAAYGYPRYTGNLDVFIAISPSNAQGIVATFREFGFGSLDIQEQDFLDDDMIVEIGREPLKIQVMTSISGVAFEECYRSRAHLDFGGRILPFISYEHLLLNKASTKRSKDRIDIEELERRRDPC